ncbi:MAG: hypothetical protein RJA07_1908 [Bacteroidota bacterium]|jgi:hypothetical protein
MNNIILIEPQYLPPITFFKMIKNSKGLQIEQYEHYIKSTYRNRCYIAGPNGVILLSIPLKKGKYQQHTAVKDVHISYENNWQKEHWKTIMFSYRSSPYFEYYEESFKTIYSTKYEKLIDLNMDLLHLIIKHLQLNIEINYTTSYEKANANMDDKRNFLKPNSAVENTFILPKYYQVFESKTGFLPNMSIIDLLFAEGNNASSFL